jgi:alkanesulfonate monooxygenase SsuD/methylene tetrahydromethanopterin reductase-like flavin-dependent oxidoreductase (luciferase family)
VARATLRPPAVLRASFDTLARIAPGRVIAGIGAGDDESIAEDAAFGVLPGDPAPAGSGTADIDPGAYRLERLEAAVDTLAGRAYPVWVAGVSPAAVRLAAERAEGWNRWGGLPASFGAAAQRVRAEVANAGRDRDAFSYTWGGLALLGDTRDEAAAKRDRLGGDRPEVVCGDPPLVAEAIAAYAAAGADWVILGPIDSANPSNPALLGNAVALIRSN